MNKINKNTADPRAIAICELRRRIDNALKTTADHAIANVGDWNAQWGANLVRQALGYPRVRWYGDRTGELPEHRQIYTPCSCGATASDCDFETVAAWIRCRFCKAQSPKPKDSDE